jgi:hypothetical protein
VGDEVRAEVLPVAEVAVPLLVAEKVFSVLQDGNGNDDLSSDDDEGSDSDHDDGGGSGRQRQRQSHVPPFQDDSFWYLVVQVPHLSQGGL